MRISGNYREEFRSVAAMFSLSVISQFRLLKQINRALSLTAPDRPLHVCARARLFRPFAQTASDSLQEHGAATSARRSFIFTGRNRFNAMRLIRCGQSSNHTLVALI